MATYSQDYPDPGSDRNLLKVLIACAQKILRNNADARDVVSDVLLAWHSNPKVHIDNLTAYLRRCVVNKCFEVIRKRNLTTSVPEDPREDMPDDAAETKRLASILKIYPDAMQMLKEKCTEKQFEVFQLWLNGESYEEIAQQMNMDIGAMSSALYRAKKNARTLAAKVQSMLDRLED
jgi:RNA polymerase sigma factor (sigma-70 family)